MFCYNCNLHETVNFSHWCRVCTERMYGTRSTEEGVKKRHTPDPFTHLFFCSTCGVEVYRREHVRVKTKKLMAKIAQASRLALVQHVNRAQHSARLTGELRINERFGDDGFEVKGTEGMGPEHCRASRVLPALGLL
jgi:hypothetical protein